MKKGKTCEASSASDLPMADRSLPVAILCGGRGTRLRPRTDILPKAMIPVNGRPMLDYILDFFRTKGFCQFVFCVGYMGQLIEEHYRDAPPGCRHVFSCAGPEASMLRRLWAIRDLGVDRFLVTYGDTFIDLDVDQFSRAHEASGAVATIVTAPIRNPFGIVETDADDRVTKFVEKPVFDHYIGAFIFETAGLDLISQELLAMADGDGLVELFNQLANKGLLRAFRHHGPKITFNTETEHQSAEDFLGRYFTFKEQL
ncbi:MAG: nucleotidyltransferase family protein [Desulfomonile tiedjei]|nr:nucleotidyltransferase family protein [Desulfomonile tiedjei]